MISLRRTVTAQRISSSIDDVRLHAQQTLGLSPHDVQIQGGLVIERGGIAEMETGEGKTLTAVLPAILHARAGRPVLIATANDYLAQRDADSLKPLYEALGHSVAAIQAGQSRIEKQQLYAADIVYGTARSFGFDYLRDRLETRRRQEGRVVVSSSMPARVQRDPGFLLVDEADSLLIDEARTPLIISGPQGEESTAELAAYCWAAEAVTQLKIERDYVLSDQFHHPALTPRGRQWLRGATLPKEAAPLTLTSLQHFLERALLVNHRFHRDRHYVVREGKVQLVDEYTGRIQEGRTISDGLHQAIEARETVPITPENGALARITLQQYIRQFPCLGGMTGTAREASREFRTVYGLSTTTVSTHRPLQRRQWADRLFPTRDEKLQAIVAEAVEVCASGRAVLIGCPTIARSNELAERLSELDVDYRLLNALNPEAEAEVIAAAGEPGRITIATNMAGRGTDIRLEESVSKAGGLHVIGSELHSSARIDRQLFGRCGRQGDPGTYRQYACGEDEILVQATQLAGRNWLGRNRHFAANTMTQLRRAQQVVEHAHSVQRQELEDTEQRRRTTALSLGLDPILDAIT